MSKPYLMRLQRQSGWRRVPCRYQLRLTPCLCLPPLHPTQELPVVVESGTLLYALNEYLAR